MILNKVLRFSRKSSTRLFRNSQCQITYQLLTPEDKPEFQKILSSKEYEGTPLRQYLNISNSEELIKADCDVIDSYCSIKAVSSSGEIVGFITNKIASRFDTEIQEYSKDPNLIKYKIFGRLIEDSYNIFEENPDIDEYLDMILGYVQPNFR